MKPYRFIVDTNVVAAGLVTGHPDGPTAPILNAMLSGGLIYLLSPDFLNEYRHVLLRPKLARLHSLRKRELEQIPIELTANAVWREPPADKSCLSPDPGDHHLWDLLASEPSAILITGDRRLIDNAKPQCSVISPAAWNKTFRHK